VTVWAALCAKAGCATGGLGDKWTCGRPAQPCGHILAHHHEKTEASQSNIVRS
jgi:hypothetical protein